jgi:hypothetical protein
MGYLLRVWADEVDRMPVYAQCRNTVQEEAEMTDEHLELQTRVIETHGLSRGFPNPE